MILREVEIEDYRSIKGPFTLHLDDKTTVILGANDHGKTNILAALGHLSENARFSVDDVNWDLAESPGEYPQVTYRLELSDDERTAVLKLWRSQSSEDSATPYISQVPDTIDLVRQGIFGDLAWPTSEVVSFV